MKTPLRLMEIKRLLSCILVLPALIQSFDLPSSDEGLRKQVRRYETLNDVGVSDRLVKRSLDNPKHKVRMVQFNTLGRDFKLYVQPKPELFHPKFQAVSVDADGNERPIGVDVYSFYHGHVYGEKESDVSLHWEGQAMSATIETPEDTYIVEPSWRHLPASPNYTMISYKASDVIADVVQDKKKFCQSLKPPDRENLTLVAPPPTIDDSASSESNVTRSKRALWTPSRDTCPLGLTADYRFFQNMGRSSLADTTSYLIALIERVDALYRRTKFDDTYQKFGYEIKKILVHDSATRTIGDEKHYNMAKQDSWEARDFLEYFSRGDHYREFCLSHIFTYQSFKGGVLGLAYIGSPRTYSIGGVCSEAYYQGGVIQSLNTGWSSYKNRYGYKITAREGDLVTAHEFGHNWGSEHDADTAECSPSAYNGGKFLMFPYSVSGYEKNNQYFSPCSKKAIAAVLRSKSDKCFVKPDPTRPYCGNNLVEQGEECDAGIAGQQGSDNCCDHQCKFRPAAVCSDRNSACCRFCQYEQADVVCQEAYYIDVSCRGTAKCTGTSALCPEPEPKADGSPCIDQGECQRGQCVPFCRKLGMIPCACDDPVSSCLFCCQKDELSACEPYMPPNNQSALLLPDGRPCIYGQCLKGVCERQVQDMVERLWSVIEKLTPSTFVRFMKDNIVLTVVFLSMVIWIPCSCAISHWDRQRLYEEEEEERWMSGMNTELVSSRSRVLVRPSAAMTSRVRADDKLPPKPGYREDRIAGDEARPQQPRRDEVRFRDSDDVFEEGRYVPRHQPGTYYRPAPRGRGFVDPGMPRTNHPEGLDRPTWPRPSDPAHYHLHTNNQGGRGTQV